MYILFFYLTGKTRSRKKNGLRRSSSQLSVPGGDDQVLIKQGKTLASRFTDTHGASLTSYISHTLY